MKLHDVLNTHVHENSRIRHNLIKLLSFLHRYPLFFYVLCFSFVSCSSKLRFPRAKRKKKIIFRVRKYTASHNFFQMKNYSTNDPRQKFLPVLWILILMSAIKGNASREPCKNKCRPSLGEGIFCELPLLH